MKKAGCFYEQGAQGQRRSILLSPQRRLFPISNPAKIKARRTAIITDTPRATLRTMCSCACAHLCFHLRMYCLTNGQMGLRSVRIMAAFRANCLTLSSSQRVGFSYRTTQVLLCRPLPEQCPSPYDVVDTRTAADAEADWVHSPS